MTWLFGIAILTCVLGQWTKVKDLYQNRNTFSVQALYIDQKNGDHHFVFGHPLTNSLIYWKTNKDLKLLSSHTFRHNIEFLKAKIRRGHDQETLFLILECERVINIHHMYFEQFVAISPDSGELWTEIVQAPHAEDYCSRFGTAFIPIKETGELYWFYSKLCQSGKNEICMSVKKKNTDTFSDEKVIYESTHYAISKSSFIAEYTLDGDTPVIHLMWFGEKSFDTPLLYMQSRDLSKTFTEPVRISPNLDIYAGFFSLDLATNEQSSQFLVGTYAVSPFNTLRMFYSKDHGKTFHVIQATESHKVFYKWFYHTNSMTINGPKSSPKFGMLSQQTKDVIEFGLWDINTMTVKRDIEHPFTEIKKASGVTIGSYFESGKLMFTIIIPVLKDDDLYHLLTSQKTILL